eukprot:scaffold29704_cov63-Phaeocystis_antarctica.AAC.1
MQICETDPTPLWVLSSLLSPGFDFSGVMRHPTTPDREKTASEETKVRARDRVVVGKIGRSAGRRRSPVGRRYGFIVFINICITSAMPDAYHRSIIGGARSHQISKVRAESRATMEQLRVVRVCAP